MVEPFSFQISCAAFDAKKAISADGQGRIDVSGNQVRLDDVKIYSDLAKFSFGELTETFPVLAAAGLRDMQGNFDAKINQVIVGIEGMPVLVLQGSLTQGRIVSSKIPEDIENLNAFFEYSNQNFDILESGFDLAGGHVAFKGRLEDVMKAQLYNWDMKLNDIELKSFAPQLPEEIELSGKLNGSAALMGAGFQPTDIVRRLSGETGFVVVDGKLENFNLLNFIFRKISIIPNLAQRFEQSLPEEYRAKMRADQTVFSDIGINMTLDKGVISYSTNLLADIAEVSARGTLNWKNDFNFAGEFLLPETLSQHLVAEIKEFSSIADGQTGKVVIPLADYTGPLNTFKTFPDMEYLAAKVVVSKVKEEIKEEVRDFLGGLIGIDGGTDASVPTEGGAERQDTGELPEPDIVDTIFDSIFH